ncbi:MAG: type II secretion system protein GspK [Deltaproteobacteria bacterium]|nr:type II secretion system protein GspK [Deltaproteobacteria bacterium]
MATPTPRKRKKAARGAGLRASERGVALIMVTAVIAVLTAVAVEFTYRERVSMHLAANARDALRAEYLARSAVDLSRLILSFQTQLDSQQIPGLSELIGMAGGGATPAADPTAQQGQSGGLGIRLWELIPIDCGMVQMLVQMAGKPPDPSDVLDPDGMPKASFGDFDGGCRAEINDEEGRININQLDALGSQSKAALLQLMSLIQDPRYDFLFDEENRHGVKLTRPDLVVALRDYIDADQMQSNLIMGAQGPEMAEGAGDEGYLYSKYDPPYEPKNAPLDSYEELYQIAGVDDDFMAAFGDRLTVYTDKNAKLNVTPKNPLDLCMKLVIASEDPLLGVQQCQDPILMTNLWEQIQLSRAAMPWVGLQPQTFRSLLEGVGVAVNPYIWTGPNAIFGASSKTFTIEATGEVGDVTRTFIAVVRMDGSHPMGRLVHWQEK